MTSFSHEIDLYPTDLQFSIFSSEDVRKLSVIKVVTGLTFDTLGNALRGGLYDPVMGSYGKAMDPCQTCFSMSTCPGHFGHIELNALVFNPLFIKLVQDIMKISCLECYQLQIPIHIQQVVATQLDLVDKGYITEAQELEALKTETIFAEGLGSTPESLDDALQHPKIQEMQELLMSDTTIAQTTKTTMAIRTAIVNDAMQVPKLQNCRFCHQQLKRIRYLYRKLVMYMTKQERQAYKDKDMLREEMNVPHRAVLADECRQFLREIYNRSSNLLKKLFPILNCLSTNATCPMDCLFMDVVLVTPPKARPTNVLHGEILEHPNTTVYKNIIEANSVLRLVLLNMKNSGDLMNNESKVVYESAKGSTAYEKMYYAWQELQSNVDTLLDSTGGRDKLKVQGLKQIIEKKEGLIRKHMMGKRVNYAARTVISPDPNINVEEVGVPDIFAKKLTYPVPVTSWNISELRKMVMNGPNIHPGANYIEDEKGYKTMIPGDNPGKRESMAKLLLTKPENGVKVVHRHLLNGDILLFNRQPSLHKPSIMAHKARILPGERTFRLHYSNCKSYNADFDGDEMNAHFPQSEVARSEAYNIVGVPHQYLVPKDGTPLGGLIQDHIIAGVKLTMRGRFFNREAYQQLVFQGLSHMKGDIKLIPPAIMKPFRLWSGKQIISTIINNIIPKGYPKINLTSNAKISAKAWQAHEAHKTIYGGTQLKMNEMSESEVIIRKGELLCGVLDKQQYGATPYGLVHCMYELYGGECSTNLLTAFTKLFTTFLQREGFTLGLRDILLSPKADEERRQIIEECRQVGRSITCEALELDEDVSNEVLEEKLHEAYAKDPKFRVILDRKYKTVLDNYTNNINKACIPNGLLCKFPENNLQLMVLSGAKGSMVNAMQISCLLGQIELEGKRPPLMISRKPLPSYPVYETSPVSGGFVDGRFLTGIQPREFFYHCMAGREGLIDTAVKTSRSGYLQRCLIKHLEGLTVNYDLTVRDSDNSVIQFLYGEDGMDVCKSQFLNPKSVKFLDENLDVIKYATNEDNKETDAQLHKYHKKLKAWRKKNKSTTRKQRISSFQQFSAELRDEIDVKNPKKLNKETGRLKKDEKIIALWEKADAEQKNSYSKKYAKCPDPLNSKFKPDKYYGAISENLESVMEEYSANEPERKSEIKDILYSKGIRSMAVPGEPVGLLAAQSIGEPSTQMTLNTFHFAGRGEMNVTLGIPRLREILMMASANIKTPSMDIPFKPNQEKNAEKLRIKLNRVTVADILEYINVKKKLVLRPERHFQYELFFKFLPKDAYEEDFCIKPKQIVKYVSNTFVKSILRAISKASKSKYSMVEIGGKDTKENARNDDDDDDNNEPKGKEKSRAQNTDANDTSDEEAADDGDDATGIKLKAKQKDENDYDDPDDEEELHDANESDDDNQLDPNDEEGENKNKEIEDENIAETVMSNEMVNDYEYDKVNYLWCRILFKLSVKYQIADISHILREVAQKSIIYEVDKINRAITYTNNNDLMLKTDGINIVEMFKYNKILDLNRLYTNDIHAVSKTYGIEAAARVIVKEVKNVFQVYGITVNPRHLLLIADYMTFDGTFKPLSRKGMEFSSSPLQQMSFESSLQFLRSAAVGGKHDDLGSPSGRLMVGLPIKCGTGSFDLLTKIC